jgi:peptidoglycan/LPS O-acetylase OafA/YrhL
MRDSARVGELDGLRGVSIALVLLFHYFVQHIETRPGSLGAYLQKYLSLTWAGVDVFFVLSGFLLGGILLDQRGAENFFRVFYLRRALRIMPPYALFLALFALALALLPAATHPAMSWLLTDPLPFWAYVLYLQNFFMAGEGRLGPNFGAPTWSLAVEEQFYLLFPLLIYYCPPRRIFHVLVALVCAAPLLRAALYFAAPEGALAGFVLLPSRWDSLLLGALAAWAVRQESVRQWIAAHPPGLGKAFVASIGVISIFPFLGFGQLSLGMALLGHLWIAASVALLLALMAQGQLAGVARLLRVRPLCFLGRISYTVYLLHQPVRGILTAMVFDGNPRIGSTSELALAVGALAATVALATATWHAFEARLIRLGHTSAYRKSMAP